MDPKLVLVQSALSKMEHLPEPCKHLLIAILAPSLGDGSERHKAQTAALGMIEEALAQEKSRIEECITASEEKLTEFNASKTEKDGEQEAAEAAIAERKDEEQKQKTLLEEASEATRIARKALAEAQEAKTHSGKTFEANTQEKEMMEKAFGEHVKTPMDAGEGINFSALQPLLGKLALDESLLSALASSCCKPKDQRGAFDNVVLDELQKAFSKRIAELTSLLEEEGPAATERDSKVQASESDLEAKRVAEQELVVAYEAAQKAVQEASQEAASASKAAASAAMGAQVEEQAKAALKLQLSEFEDGPFRTFAALNKPQEVSVDKMEVAVEMAPADA